MIWIFIKWFVFNFIGWYFFVNGFVRRESKGMLIIIRFGFVKFVIMNEIMVKYWLFGSYENCIYVVCYNGGYLVRFGLFICNKIIFFC